MGNSAGGNLTAALSLLVSFTSGSCVEFRNSLSPNFRQVLQILLYPSLRLTVPYSKRWADGDEQVKAKSLPIWVAEMMEGSYLPPYINKEQIFIAPLLTEVNLLKSLELSPAIILTAGMDCLKFEASEYADKLKDAGLPVILKNYPDCIHGFTHYPEGSKDYREDDVRNSWQEVTDALKRAFGTAAT
jgi:acetyl esterase